MESVDGSSIISALGAGSGINTRSIIDQLVEIEKAPKQASIDSKRETLETKISDFGLTRSALATLQDAVALMADGTAFEAKSATFTDSEALIPQALDNEAPVGDYTFEVQDIARAQSLSTNAAFSDLSDAVGKGTLTFKFGEWDTQNPPEVFTQDTEQESFTVIIDDSNNSLIGLRDAINAAERGVQASIINDGTDYRLVITAPSGASNELEITVAEDGASPTNTDANDLSRFAFGAGIAGANQQMIQNQSGNDAALVVNGLDVTRSTNEIDDIIDGFTFSLTKADPGTVMNVSITEDKAGAEETVRTFVEAYNLFLETMEPITGFNEEEEADGSLKRDATARGILNQIRATIISAIPGLDEGFTTLGSIGIRTELDGTMSIDEETFTSAFEDNFDLVKDLFSPQTDSTSDKIIVNSFGAQTVPGSYAVVITQDPEKGSLVGAAAAGTLLTDLTTAGANDYDFTITVDGTASGTISVTPGNYTNDQLAALLQSQINGDETLKAAGADVDVIWNTDHFEVTSRAYGTKSTVSVTAVGASAGDLGLDSGTTTQGKDVAGTFDGVTGFGVGNVLLPALNTDPSGLSLIVEPGATSANIDFSGGFGRELDQLIDQFLQSSGTIENRETTLNGDLEELDDDQEQLDRRIAAFQARLESQFLAMESILNGLNTSGTFLDGILDRLPFTASSS